MQRTETESHWRTLEGAGEQNVKFNVPVSNMQPPGVSCRRTTRLELPIRKEAHHAAAARLPAAQMSVGEMTEAHVQRSVHRTLPDQAGLEGGEVEVLQAGTCCAPSTGHRRSLSTRWLTVGSQSVSCID